MRNCAYELGVIKRISHQFGSLFHYQKVSLLRVKMHLNRRLPFQRSTAQDLVTDRNMNTVSGSNCYSKATVLRTLKMIISVIGG